MSEHVLSYNMPRGYRSADKVAGASDDKLQELMALCHAEPSEPMQCLSCYAYLVSIRREGRALRCAANARKLKARNKTGTGGDSKDEPEYLPGQVQASALEALFYALIRDGHLSPGLIEEELGKLEPGTKYVLSIPEIGSYAKSVVARVRGPY